MVVQERACGPKCHSRQHAAQLISVVSKGSLRQTQLFLSQCHNHTNIVDQYGRTVLHVAASCGRWELVEWLLTERAADVTPRDAESGWTALHRALFYGQLTCARLLISHGASLQTRDKEGLSPLDIVMKDRLPHVEFVQSGLNEVFTWGDNSNFTLGHKAEHRRRFPEAIDSFRRKAISIKQLVMCKYHTVFLSTVGQVYTCGHGQGGRLGHDNEQTCLEPTLVAALKDKVCDQVTAARDHTFMLMESGAVYSCGLNDFQQLGHQGDKYLLPKPVSSKLLNMLKGKILAGVLTSRYHTVLYTKHSVFTFGLNAGQLGHQKTAGENTVSQPRQVSALMHKDMTVKLVAVSDAATVVVSTKGDVYALHEYQCRRIVSKRLDITEVLVSGGHLDHRTEQETLQEHGGSELTVVLRTSSGKVYLWRASQPLLCRCAWLIRRPLFVTQMKLTLHSILFVTQDGEAFTAALPRNKHRATHPAKEAAVSTGAVEMFGLTLADLVARDETQELSIERVAQVHRATYITADNKARNFCVLQAQSNASLTEIPSVQASSLEKDFQLLYEEADSTDSVHDVILKVGASRVAAHKYILARGSEFFHKLFISSLEGEDVLEPGRVSEVEIDCETPDLFLQLLRFLYTDSCDLLTPGKHISLVRRPAADLTANVIQDWVLSCDVSPVVLNGHTTSAYAVHQKHNKGAKNKSKTMKTPEKQPVDTSQDRNPVKLLQDLAHKFGVNRLQKRLSAVEYKNGVIKRVSGKQLSPPSLRIARKKCMELFDVCIRSEDIVLVQCHKCVLVARLEYFRSMLASGWIETSNTQALTLPIPGDILKVIVDFLYVDDSSVVKDCQDAELVCNVLVVADQLLIERLKDICEVTITCLVNLKNACELLQFASVYNAKQLITACQQFITINLAALLETRTLDCLSEDVLEQLTTYYKNTISGISCRQITPYDSWPHQRHLEALEAECEGLTLEGATGTLETMSEISARKFKSRRKRTRTKSSGDEEKTSESSTKRGHKISVSSIELEDIEESCDGPSEVPSQPETAAIIVRVTKSLAIPSSTTHVAIPSDAQPHPQTPPSPELFPLASPGSAPSSGLRDIMAREAALVEQTKQASVVTSTGKKSGRLSQRERKKRLISESADKPSAPPAAVSPSSPDEPTTPSSTGNPWGAVPQMVQSFRDLVLFENKEDPSREQTRAPRAHGAGDSGKHHSSVTPNETTLSWGIQIPNRSTSQTTACSHGDGASPIPASPAAENPWQLSPCSVEPEDTAQGSVSFDQIVRDELQQTATLHRATNKPLALIQAEEQAIQELLVHYGNRNYSEIISVERLQTHLAQPTWAAAHRHKHPAPY